MLIAQHFADVPETRLQEHMMQQQFREEASELRIRVSSLHQGFAPDMCMLQCSTMTLM